MTAQIGRAPREPWRVIASCAFGYPSVVASPARLEDGTPFPTWAWLTCPHLVARAGLLESEGAIDEWAHRLAADASLGEALAEADARMRALRREEGPQGDDFPDVGIAGQRTATHVKCLHAHTALALAGVDDPIGVWVLGAEQLCSDERCATIATGG